MTDALHFLTIDEASRRIGDGSLSPVDLVQAVADRIAAVDPAINSYVTPTIDAALADARTAAAEIAAGRRIGPLHGIPVGIKDIFATKGVRTTAHSHILADNVPDEDCVAVARLKAAGAVVMGKLATHEFAFGGPDWTLPFPPARNPWNRDHFTGGSSSGSGASVAAGLCLGAMGSDTAGSIRMPAAFCGIAGIKPSYGRVSRRGVAPLAFSLDHAGPMTWTSRDAALMLQAIAGHDARDTASADVPVPDYAAALTGSVSGLRIGVVRHFYEEDDRADAEVLTAMDAGYDVLRGLGATVEDVRLSPAQDYSACCNVIMLSEAFAIHESDLRTRPEKFGWILRDRMILASLLTAGDYVQATRARRQLAAEMEAALERYDVLVTAGAWTPAPRIDAISPYYLFRRPLLTAPCDVTGLPALSVCNGFSASGLPLAMQVLGRRFDEATVLRVGDAYERATPWRGRRPNL
ncbi:aspartyl-tRNA(Asn)/glutamyl-tRNA(Gln) amidotransferase subunit A [Stella humosa]|uniref:Aspartyl-tRNA(Asn)/glutamyl-tRNA(Gln) amidotransferase subunit A n=1 Tax=Stella humosa TaxID=94 RepID=A0A3N1M0I0_9PROT|nr:amidase [Stella humosa]ROQ00994.1 aspartyl-tRNA(Asn)/glutamyl-tRNA(Gln) amidotransferase subunit A [Stella humosa]BBK31361.1 glutamyl-tRNA(Gln) amidotransferase subunit A [Stella humosa]